MVGLGIFKLANQNMLANLMFEVLHSGALLVRIGLIDKEQLTFVIYGNR